MSRSLRRATRGKRPGFQYLYTTHLAFLRAALRWQGIAWQDLDDVQQEVLLAIHRGLPHFRPPRSAGRGGKRRPLSGRRLRLARGAGWSPFKAWVYGIVWRQASHYHQRAHRAHEVPADPEAVRALAEHRQRRQAGAGEQALARAERAALLAELIVKLRPERRLVLVLCDVLGMRVREIAWALELPLGTVQTRLRLGRRDLRVLVRRLDRERREAMRLRAFAWLTPGALQRAGAAVRGGVAAGRRLGQRIRRGLGAVGRGIAGAGERGVAGSVAAGSALALGIAAVTAGAGVVHGCAAAQVGPADATAEERAVGAVGAGAASSGEAARLRALAGPSALADRATLILAAPLQPSGGHDAAPRQPSGGREASEASEASEAMQAIERAPQPSTERRAVVAPAASERASGGAREAREEGEEKEERKLLEDAVAAFSQGDLAGALDRLTTHAARYPRSQLAGSRERLRGRVLARMARSSEPPRPPSPPSPARTRDRDRRTEQRSGEHSE